VAVRAVGVSEGDDHGRSYGSGAKKSSDAGVSDPRSPDGRRARRDRRERRRFASLHDEPHARSVCSRARSARSHGTRDAKRPSLLA
jgi:hypothetical protein